MVDQIYRMNRENMYFIQTIYDRSNTYMYIHTSTVTTILNTHDVPLRQWSLAKWWWIVTRDEHLALLRAKSFSWPQNFARIWPCFSHLHSFLKFLKHPSLTELSMPKGFTGLPPNRWLAVMVILLLLLTAYGGETAHSFASPSAQECRRNIRGFKHQI